MVIHKLTHEEYLKLINEKADFAMNHPLVRSMDKSSKTLFRIAFLNGCHALNDYYVPAIYALEEEIKALNADIQSYVEQENGEST